jgi:hypothetical protein
MKGCKPQTIEGTYLWINAKIAACPTAVTWEQKQILTIISYGWIYLHSILFIRGQEIWMMSLLQHRIKYFGHGHLDTR